MKKELSEEEYINYSLKANKPKVFFPILNTFISIGLLIAIIYYYVKNEISLPFLLFGIVVVILFPISSWYSSYFSKKKATERINDFKNETESLIKYASTFKGYQMISNPNIKFNVLSDDFINKEASFNKNDCLVNEGKITGSLVAIGASFIGLDINPKTKKVVNVTGMLPSSIWFNKKLKEPTSKKGSLEIIDDVNKYTVIQTLESANTYYDKNSGWVCIGNRKAKDTDNIMMMNNVIICLRDQEIESLWINVGIFEDNNGKDKHNEK